MFGPALLLVCLFALAVLLAGSHGRLMFRPHMTEDWVFWSIIVWSGCVGLALTVRDLRRWRRPATPAPPLAGATAPAAAGGLAASGEQPRLVRCIDVYILLEQFDEATLTFFLDRYAAGLQDAQAEHWWPREAAENEVEFRTADTRQMMRFLLQQPNPCYIFYLTARGAAVIRTAMVFFNPDKTLILGVEVPEDQEPQYRQKLAADFGSDLLLSLEGGIDRPASKQEFIQWMRPRKD